MALPEYYKSKIKLHSDLEEQLRQELLALEERNKPQSPDEQLKAEIQALLDCYQITPELMWRILDP